LTVPPVTVSQYRSSSLLLFLALLRTLFSINKPYFGNIVALLSLRATKQANLQARPSWNHRWERPFPSLEDDMAGPMQLHTLRKWI